MDFAQLCSIMSRCARGFILAGQRSRSGGLDDSTLNNLLVFQGCKKPVLCVAWVNPVPNDRIVDWSKSKAFADDTINATYRRKFSFGCPVENIVGKGENAGYHHFLLFPLSVFKSFLFQRC